MVMTGITLFAYVDGFESANILGVLLAVGSAVGAAFYKVLHPPLLSTPTRNLVN